MSTTPLPPLSVCLIVKDEAAVIARCLGTVREADDIVILDTGSTDGTAAAVRALGLPQARFIEGAYTWRDDFSHARNASLDLARHEWALVIDADDVLEHDGIRDIQEAIQAAPERRTFDVLLRYENAPGTQFVYPKVLRRAVARFEGTIHESTTARDAGPPVATMTVGRSPTHDADPDFDLRLLRAAVEREPRSGRYRYYLARELYGRGEDEAAVPHFVQAVKDSGHRAMSADALLYLARIFWRRSQGQAARDYCLKALELNPDFREALCLMAEMSWPRQAAVWRRIAAQAGNTDVLFIRACACGRPKPRATALSPHPQSPSP